MRPLEAIAGIVSLGGLAVWTSPHADRFWLRPLGFFLLCLLIAHILWEGWRLQAMPIYFSALVLISCSGYPRICSSASALAGLCGLLLCYAIPVFALPAPTGPHRIGMRSLYLTDSGREEKHGGGAREFVAAIWYPAQAVKGRATVYRDPEALTARSHHQRLVETHTIQEAPVLPEPKGWPVVFFSPSSGGYRTQNTFLCEELASHGYVVVGVDHPYSSSRVKMQDGRVIHSLSSDWLQIATQETWKASRPVVEDTLETRVGDVLYAWKALEAHEELPIDFTRAAAIGHSFGGAVAAELCRRDARFRAGANFDGWMFSGVQKSGVGPNFLFAIEDDPLWFRNEGPYENNPGGNARLGTKEHHDTIRRSLQLYGGYLWRPEAARHVDFSDIALYLRWPFPGQARGNEKRVRKIHEQTRQIVLALLDRHLKGKESSNLRQLTYVKEGS